MRQAMRRAGFTEPEIDQTLLVGYLQRCFHCRWAVLACLLWFGLWFLDVFGGLWILVAGMVGLWLALIVPARIHAHSIAKREDWVRVKGGGSDETADWALAERRLPLIGRRQTTNYHGETRAVSRRPRPVGPELSGGGSFRPVASWSK